MKKSITVLFAMLVNVAMWAGNLYLKSSTVDYPADNAVVAIWSWGGSEAGAWSTFQASETSGVYYAVLPEGRTGGKIMRWPSGTTPSWDVEGSAWNKTGDITFPETFPATTDMLELNDWNDATSGTWTKYVAPDPAPAEKDSIYFVNVYDWATPTAHLWDGTATGTTWPGMELSKPIGKSSNGHDVYKIVADKGAYTKCIFSNNGTNQTADLAWTSKKYFYKKKWYDTLPVIKTVKLIPNTDWKSADAKFAAWIWGEGLDGEWTEFFTGTDTMSVEFNAAADSIDFVRLNSSVEEPKWNEKEGDNFVWNEAKDTIDYAGLTYSITGWTSGTWKPYLPVSYYATGNTALVTDGGSESGEWNAQAFKTYTDTLTISGLKTGVDYALKVCPDGVLDDDHLGKGYSDLTVHTAGLTHDGDNNICFKMATDGAIKVVYNSDVFKLLGDFYVKPVEKKKLKLVLSDEWADGYAKFAGWIWGNDLEDEWTSFFTPISTGNDTLQVDIPISADSIVFVRFSPRASEPAWGSQSGYNVVWNEMKTIINYESLVWSVIGWDKGQWEPYAYPCTDFGLMVEEEYKPGKHNVMQTEWQEYSILSLELTAGQTFKVHNHCNGDSWVINTYAATSYTNFDKTSDHYVVKENGIYDFYLKLSESDEIFVSKQGHYTQAVPSQCEDVMMQAFYNESYKVNDPVYGTDLYGDTKWNTLLPQVEEISSYFDLVWLPPSASGDGMGYHPKRYSDQNSNWGSQTELKSLITAFHNHNTKVVADIVINHCVGWSSWCDFPTLDFGDYGTFQPDASYICQNDEVNSSPSAGFCYGAATGSYDDGENWDGARDWAHNDVKVQEMFKAYLRWMREEIGYDGFRYDKGDGFNNWHHSNYNKAAGPYIAFMECYSNTDEIQGRIAGAEYNLMGLDFDTKWHVFDDFAGWWYGQHRGKNRGDGLLGRNDTKHAITFIDSHDWFLRNGSEFGGQGNSMKDYMLPRLLQANAFMLSMPSVPCVFYPHWYKYKEFIKPMIEARKAAGVHNESEIRDEYFSNDGKGYQATIVGKEGGYLILCLGDKAHASGFEGFELMASYYSDPKAENEYHDESYQMWVHRRTPETPTTIDNVTEPQIKAEKFVKDGKLYIRMGNKVYDILGQTIK